MTPDSNDSPPGIIYKTYFYKTASLIRKTIYIAPDTYTTVLQCPRKLYIRW